MPFCFCSEGERMKKLEKNILKAVLLLLPLVLGTAGLISAGESPINALFNGITMYGMNYGDEPANWMVQAARWLAPVATVSGIALMFASVAKMAYAWFSYLRGDSVAVYGNEELADSIRSTCSYPVVTGEEKLLPAHRYVLFWDEEKNLDFFLEHRKELEKRQVYMRCSALRSQVSAGAALHLFSAEETAARLYWKQAEMYALSCKKNHEMIIVFIGFGKLGEELLTWGLQNNIFHPGQRISYHIYGDAEGYLSLHRELAQVSDKVVCHSEPWNRDLVTVQAADRIIVCEQERQTETIQDLLFAIPEKRLDILAEQPEILDLIEEKDRLAVFRWRTEAMKPQNIFDEQTLRRAKAINLRYAHLYRSVEETAENAEKEWNQLDSFTRYSNISAADYHEIRMQMLKLWGGTEINDDQLELLSELEHIRWSRFHYLNNWRYEKLPDGVRKDSVRRIHRDLIPYSELDEPAKEKDRENIRVMLKIR